MRLNVLSPFNALDYRQFDTTNRLARIWYRARLYSKIVLATRGRTPVPSLVRKQFPMMLRDASAPPTLCIEFTNYCNLACTYCSSPLKLRPQGFMQPATFNRMLQQIKETGIGWVSIVGNGEPTLHRQFPEWVRQIARATKFVELTTNLQRTDERLLRSIVEAPVNLVHVSVDGASKEEYERMRVGGNFERLLRNLRALERLKAQTRSPTVVDVRVLLLPAQREREARILEFWRDFADVVSKQYVVNFDRGSEGYDSTYKSNARCTLPFKILDVNWDGNVPMCTYSRMQTGNPQRLTLGNINEQTIARMWNGPIIQQYRDGHRYQREELVPMCKGCSGRG
jgi:MoaA/NifB/PqqE/SkfB family radical SAM enzyme